jgi:predicted transcriptional regulator
MSEIDRAKIAAQIRATRAILDWSQTDLARCTGLTQRSIHRIEHGMTRIRRSTARSIQRAFEETGVRIEETPDGGFRISVPEQLLSRQTDPARR